MKLGANSAELLGILMFSPNHRRSECLDSANNSSTTCQENLSISPQKVLDLSPSLFSLPGFSLHYVTWPTGTVS